MENKENIELKEDINALVIDSILEKPITFTIDGRFFYIYPPSLGISMLSSDLFSEIQFNKILLNMNKNLECLRATNEKRECIVRIIAYHSFKNREDALEEELVQKRMSELQDMDLASMWCVLERIMEWGGYYEKFYEHLGLKEEKKRRDKVNAVKDHSSSITFGGKSIYGMLLDFAAERYGWRVDYILWGVSLTTLNMMMSDSVTSVYLTKDEAAKCGVPTDGIVIKAGDKNSVKQLLEMQKRVK